MCSSGIGSLQEIAHRKKFTLKNLKELQKRLPEGKEICGDRACAYATGSYGRLEATTDSDLDLFIVGLPIFQEEVTQDVIIKRQLNRLDEISLKAELIKATKSLDLPEFDGDGEYLKHYTGGMFTLTKH